MTWRELPVEQFIKFDHALVVDVRSPGEHEAERIPDSINVPLLTDRERAEVGTIYNNEGELVARKRALTILSPKIPGFVDEVLAHRQHGQTVVIYCWRGGLRSEAVSSALSMAGVDCFRLTGGFKAWRTRVLADLDADRYAFRGITLVGLTGTGKTELLAALSKHGLQTLDLEHLANHRGSVFGGLGLGQQPTQKNFEAAIWCALRKLRDEPVFLEGESRKIGRISLPDCILRRIVEGPFVHVRCTIARRAERITQDYLSHAKGTAGNHALAEALDLLDRLKPRLSTKRVRELKELLSNGSILEAVQNLLIEYYDPLYNHQLDRCYPFALEVDGDNAEAAAEIIKQWTRTPAPLASGS